MDEAAERLPAGRDELYSGNADMTRGTPPEEVNSLVFLLRWVVTKVKALER
jgi:hypothetical protein